MLIDTPLMRSPNGFAINILCNAGQFLKVFVLVLFIITPISFINVTDALAAEEDKNIPPDIYNLLNDGENVAKELSKVVGVSISPLLGISAVGAYNYYKTNEIDRPNLPWHSSPKFWSPLLIILFLFIVKDAVKTIMPLPKFIIVPLDALEALENKISALIAVPFVLSTINSLHMDAVSGVAAEISFSILSVAYAGEPVAEGLATNWTATLYILLLSFIALSSFIFVWLVSHTVNIFILLSPFSIIDFFLKLFRLLIIALLLVTNIINPFLSLILALILVVIAFFISGWAFRIMIFGTLNSFDIILRRHNHLEKDNQENKLMAFAGRGLDNVPSMSFGKIKGKDDAELEFVYRPFLILPKRKTSFSKDGLVIGIGTISPIIIRPVKGANSFVSIIRLRPQYKTHEEYVASKLGIAGVKDITLGKGINQAWQWLRGQFATNNT